MNQQAQQIPANQQAQQIPANQQAQQIPANQQAQQIPANQQAQQIPANQQAQQIPANQQAQQIPANQQAQQIPANQQAQQIPANQQAQQIPANQLDWRRHFGTIMQVVDGQNSLNIRNQVASEMVSQIRNHHLEHYQDEEHIKVLYAIASFICVRFQNPQARPLVLFEDRIKGILDHTNDNAFKLFVAGSLNPPPDARNLLHRINDLRVQHGGQITVDDAQELVEMVKIVVGVSAMRSAIRGI